MQAAMQQQAQQQRVAAGTTSAKPAVVPAAVRPCAPRAGSSRAPSVVARVAEAEAPTRKALNTKRSAEVRECVAGLNQGELRCSGGCVHACRAAHRHWHEHGEAGSQSGRQARRLGRLGTRGSPQMREVLAVLASPPGGLQVAYSMCDALRACVCAHLHHARRA